MELAQPFAPDRSLKWICRPVIMTAKQKYLSRSPPMSIPPYRVSAYNTSKASENKIHDDATARRFGFRGGFVGGVNVYAYMAHQPVARWGRAWLENGTGSARFMKPAYEGDIAEVTAVEDAEGLALEVYSQGVHCASGRA